MPIVEQSSAVWDLNVTIRSSAPLSRLVSINHPICVQFLSDCTVASVQLADTVDRRRVPCKDFVLLFRDMAIDEQMPTALKVEGKSGHQALSISILPDFRPVKVKLRASKLTDAFSSETGKDIDFNPEKSYETNIFDEEEKEPQEFVVLEPKPCEYIFLVDRSGSMSSTIALVR